MINETELLIFCKNIKWIRIENNFSKSEMAKRLGIGIRSLTLLESGIIPSKLSCAVLFQIQNNFGIAPKDLFRPLW